MRTKTSIENLFANTGFYKKGGPILSFINTNKKIHIQFSSGDFLQVFCLIPPKWLVFKIDLFETKILIK